MNEQFRLKTTNGALLVMLLVAAGPLSAREVFRAEDENGVVSFSDVASPGAEVILLASAQVREDTFARQQRIIEQQLSVAKSLEESRLAREAARTRRLEALANARPRTVYYREPDRTRFVGGVYRHHWRPGYPWKPGHPGVRPPHPSLPIEPPPGGGGHGTRLNPPSRTVPLPPLKGWRN
jgi:hypothetical protein